EVGMEGPQAAHTFGRQEAEKCLANLPVDSNGGVREAALLPEGLEMIAYQHVIQGKRWNVGSGNEPLLLEESDEPRESRPSLAAVPAPAAHCGDKGIDALGELSDIVAAGLFGEVREGGEEPSVVEQGAAGIVSLGQEKEKRVDEV